MPHTVDVDEFTLYRSARFDPTDLDRVLPAETIHLAVTLHPNDHGHHLFIHYSTLTSQARQDCIPHDQALRLMSETAAQLRAAGFHHR